MINKILHILTILTLLITISCQNKETRIDYDNLVKKDSITYTFNDKNFSGVAFHNYENGKLEFEKKFLGGKLFGYSSSWYDNGQIKDRSYYRLGKMDFSKAHLQWYRNGNKMQEIIPKENRLEIRMYFENGNLSSEITFHNSNYDNVYFAVYDEDGNKIESSFKEYLLFLKEFHGLDFGYIPNIKDTVEFKTGLRDSLLK